VPLEVSFPFSLFFFGLGWKVVFQSYNSSSHVWVVQTVGQPQAVWTQCEVQNRTMQTRTVQIMPSSGCGPSRVFGAVAMLQGCGIQCLWNKHVYY
jgi:hypothetical protein